MAQPGHGCICWHQREFEMGEALAALGDRMATIQDLSSVSSLLSWDQLTMMPKRGAQDRGSQIRTVKMLSHAMLVDNETGRRLESAQTELESSRATEFEAALVRVTRYDRER